MSTQSSRKHKESPTYERFCLVLSQVPPGRVCSYGALAELAELGSPRQTCRYLRLLPANSELPWYRIVSSQGKLATFTNVKRQQRLLQSEGVLFAPKNRIPKHYYWP